ncbi:hypothetical protein LTS18_007299, partial [Coniosporium uncinatum]
VWPIDWLMGLKGALPESYISEKQFPKVFAWARRFRAHVDTKKKALGKPVTLSDEDAVKYMLSASTQQSGADDVVDQADPLGLKSGEEVTVWPIESGMTGKDTGKLRRLNPDEVIIEKETRETGKNIRLHVPRWGFRVVRAGGKSKM